MNALKLYREWGERRGLKWARWWERKRARGRSHYVRWVTLFWGGGMLNFFVLRDFLSGDGFSLVQFLIMLPVCLAGGRLLGAQGWSSNEARYQRHLIGGRGNQLRR